MSALPDEPCLSDSARTRDARLTDSSEGLAPARSSAAPSADAPARPRLDFDIALLADPDAPEAPRAAEWRKVYEHFDPRLRGYFQRQEPRPDELDDLVAELWRRVHLHVGSLTSPSAAWSWLLTIGRNVLRDRGRARAADARRAAGLMAQTAAEAAELGQPVLEFFSEHPYEHHPKRERALRLIAELPKADRTLLALIAVEGRTHDEAARVLGITVPASRKRYSRLRRTVLNGLAGNE